MSSAIAVVGGSYGEECAFPRRQVYRGSGGRAAAVISSLGVDVQLHTAIGPQLANIFASIASHLNYKLVAVQAATDIWFRYRFPLGRASVYPPFASLTTSVPNVLADCALVFGMVEGRPVVNAQRAVYDPQDGIQSKHFGENGSTADELAIVVSYSEGRALTGLTDPEQIAEALLDQPGAVVAVVKCGPQGALVKSRKDSGWVHSFPTRNVYKIGSGDVFSAAFAYGWLLRSMAPIDAAWLASRMTARYVESGVDRFDQADVEDLLIQSQLAHRKAGQSGPRVVPNKQIYLAGPFFNVAQQWLIDEVRGALRDMGFKVFSPIHDVGEGLAGDIATADLTGLNESSVVLAILDGLDPGTIFEVGYARSKSIPVIAVAESVPENELTMVIGSGCYVTNDLTTGIYAVCWELMSDA